jgi:hypothetical protein
MASKLKRTPLFGYDGSLGIPILPQQIKKHNKVSVRHFGFNVDNGITIENAP